MRCIEFLGVCERFAFVSSFALRNSLGIGERMPFGYVGSLRTLRFVRVRIVWGRIRNLGNCSRAVSSLEFRFAKLIRFDLGE